MPAAASFGGRERLPAQAVERFLRLADRAPASSRSSDGAARPATARGGASRTSESSRMVWMACRVLSRRSSSRGTSTRLLLPM